VSGGGEVAVLGDIVRTFRRRQGLSQEELAESAGLSIGAIRKIENGHTATPRPVTARLLADALKLVGAERDRLLNAAAGEASNGQEAVPRQLISDVYGFTGRLTQLEELDALLRNSRGHPSAVVITAIGGTAGIGKTALAVHWAHRVADRFPDGQLYVNLRGFDPTDSPVEPAAAVRGLLDALGVRPERVPAGTEAQYALYRSMLAGRRMLILLDNARDAEQVRPLLPGTAGTLALITSRDRLTPLVATEGARPFDLDTLSTVEARELLAGRLGAARVAAEPEAVDAIIEGCARLPLALAIAAARAVQSRLPLAALAADLHDTRRRLDTLDGGDPGSRVRAVLSWSYTTLSPPAARLFRLLGMHLGPDISAAAAASLAGSPPAEVRPLLAELTRASLISEPTPGRYTWHDLLRAYASELAGADPEPERRAAQTRLLDHYTHTAHAADKHLDPARDPLPLAPAQPGATPEEPADQKQALAWFSAEHAALLAAVELAATAGFDTHTWQLAWSLASFFTRRGHWHDLIATQHAAVDAARSADPITQARTHRHLAFAYSRLRRFEDAQTQLRHALDLSTQAGDLVGSATAHRHLTVIYERQARHSEALDHARQALDLSRAAGHRHGQAHGLNSVGYNYARLGDYRQALTHCQQALTLFQELDNRVGQAATWDSLGYVHRGLGHHALSIVCHQHALDLYRDLGDRYYEAATLTRLGDTHHAAGDPGSAETAWKQALAILDELDHPDADQLRTQLATPQPPEGGPVARAGEDR
jgi:tetratricopeptide (TPR) repeat protein/transcriptional regulator with XRE-family HTH domain